MVLAATATDVIMLFTAEMQFSSTPPAQMMSLFQSSVFPSLIPSVIEVVSFGESRSPQNRHHINKLVPPKIQFNSHTLGGAAFLRSKRFNWKKKTEMLNEFDSLIPIRPYIIASIDAVNKTVQ